MHQSYERRCSRKIGWAKSYVAIDGEFGNSGDVCVFSDEGPKIQAFESQGDGLNWSSFLEEASNKGLVYRSDFFLDCVDAYLQLIETASIVRLRRWI